MNLILSDKCHLSSSYIPQPGPKYFVLNPGYSIHVRFTGRLNYVVVIKHTSHEFIEDYIPIGKYLLDDRKK